MPRDELLEVVDDNDVIIGQATREKIHRDGLLHREVHVWYVTPKGEIIFQRRAPDKDTHPNLLDATAAGHVDPSHSYDMAALREMEEETGVKATPNDIYFLAKLKTRTTDEVTHTVNNVFRGQYAYIFRGRLSSLRVEKGKGTGFEAWPIDKLLAMPEDQKSKFIPIIFTPEIQNVFKDIQKLVKEMK